MNRTTKLLLAVATVALLVGCSSSGSDDKDADAQATTTVSDAAASGADKGDDEPTAPPSTGAVDREPAPEGTGIIETTEMDSCDTDPGKVEASGTVKLPEGMEPTTAVISVSWVNASTATVFARSRVDVEVTADESVPWEVENLLPDNDVQVRCVLGAVAVD